MDTKEIEKHKISKVDKNDRKKQRIDFINQKQEMKKLLKEARVNYVNSTKQSFQKNNEEFKQIKTEFNNTINSINENYAAKKISKEEKDRLLAEASQKRTNDIEAHNSMVKNRELANVSEYKRTLTKIQKTYMNDVVKHLFWYRVKRWFFGLNKEFTRVTWWNKKNVFMDFAIIILIVAVLALIFMGIDMAYIKA